MDVQGNGKENGSEYVKRKIMERKEEGLEGLGRGRNGKMVEEGTREEEIGKKEENKAAGKRRVG